MKIYFLILSFSLIFSASSAQLVTVYDKDGYTNICKSASVKSTVIGIVKEGQVFSVSPSDDEIEKKSIYFLADTINVPQSYNILEMLRDGPMNVFVLHCSCMPPYYNSHLVYKTFSSRDKFKRGKNMPSYKFLSVKELLDVSVKEGDGFNGKYNLLMVELMPDGTYAEAPVRLEPSRKFLTVE